MRFNEVFTHHCIVIPTLKYSFLLFSIIKPIDGTQLFIKAGCMVDRESFGRIYKEYFFIYKICLMLAELINSYYIILLILDRPNYYNFIQNLISELILCYLHNAGSVM